MPTDRSRNSPGEAAAPRPPARAALAAALALTLALAGCSMLIDVPGERMPPTAIDIAELSPDSLRLPVLNFSWSYLGGQAHIRVRGTVLNDTGGPIQGVRLSGVLYDQDGTPIVFGESFVIPSYLPDGARGEFEFVGLTRRESGVTHARLVVTARTTSY